MSLTPNLGETTAALHLLHHDAEPPTLASRAVPTLGYAFLARPSSHQGLVFRPVLHTTLPGAKGPSSGRVSI